MGTIFALICATLFIGYQDKELYAIIRNMLTRPISNYFEQNWQWFLDDCFIFSRVSLIKPDELLDVLNKINLAMQFAIAQLCYGNKGQPEMVLDAMINKEEKKIFMEIYSKLMDSKRYVFFKANYSKHCLKSIPFSLARRVCMITEEDPLK